MNVTGALSDPPVSPSICGWRGIVRGALSAKLLATWVRVSVLSLIGDVTLGKSQSL